MPAPPKAKRAPGDTADWAAPSALRPRPWLSPRDMSTRPRAGVRGAISRALRRPALAARLAVLQAYPMAYPFGNLPCLLCVELWFYPICKSVPARRRRRCYGWRGSAAAACGGGDGSRVGLVGGGGVGGGRAARLGSGIRSLIRTNNSVLVFHRPGVPARRHRRCYGWRGSAAAACLGRTKRQGLSESLDGAAAGARRRGMRPDEAEAPPLAPAH